MTAAFTPLPVLGVPVASKALSGQDSLLSIVQMPAGVPVGTLAIGEPARSMRRCCLPRCWRSPTKLASGSRPGATPDGRSRRAPDRRGARPDDSRPGATIGILGAGQLGRMLAMRGAETRLAQPYLRARRRGSRLRRGGARTIAGFEDEEALSRFAAAVDVVTYEFENVPTGLRRIPRHARARAAGRAGACRDPGPAHGKGVPARSRPQDRALPRRSKTPGRWCAQSPSSAARRS